MDGDGGFGCFRPWGTISFEDYTAYWVVLRHPGGAYLDLPEQLKGVDVVTGEERELPEGLRCAPILTRGGGSDSSVQLVLEDGSVVELDGDEADGLVDSLHDTDASFLTDKKFGCQISELFVSGCHGALF